METRDTPAGTGDASDDDFLNHLDEEAQAARNATSGSTEEAAVLHDFFDAFSEVVMRARVDPDRAVNSSATNDDEAARRRQQLYTD